jgi:metal-responsive CopG/Arc/MetJ family transcriptional regulator
MTKSIELRIPDDLAAKIDARVKKVGAKSRNAWLVAALEWAVEQPPKTVTKQERV